jgi:hypothetical protein
MALTNNTLPSVLPTRVVPYDSSTAFSKAQTVTASGYVGNINTQVPVLAGRFDGLWAIDVSAATLSSNQSYQFFLVGSNDAAFTAGNVELLAIHDFAATSALRIFANNAAASSITPPNGQAVLRHVIPFCNQMGAYLFQYLQLYLLVGGTSPSITFSSWLAYDAKGR